MVVLNLVLAFLLAQSAGWILVYSLLMLLSPKSLGNYAGIFFLPLAFLSVAHNAHGAAYLWGALNVLVSIQPSLWFRLGTPSYSDGLFLREGPAGLEFAMELAMLGVLAGLVWMSGQWMAKGRNVYSGD